jgi:hypothetical protein
MVDMEKDRDACVERSKATYGPFCVELDMLRRAYVQVMRWWAAHDPMLASKQCSVN